MAEYRKNCWNLHVRIKALHSPGLESGEQKHQTVINGKSFIQSSEEPASCRATLGFISMKQSCETVRVISSPKRKTNLCLCCLWQFERDWLMSRMLKILIRETENKFLLLQHRKGSVLPGWKEKKIQGCEPENFSIVCKSTSYSGKKNSLSTKLVSHHKHLNKYYYSDCNL